MMSLTLLRFCGSPFFLFVELSSSYVAAVNIISVSHHLSIVPWRARAAGGDLPATCGSKNSLSMDFFVVVPDPFNHSFPFSATIYRWLERPASRNSPHGKQKRSQNSLSLFCLLLRLSSFDERARGRRVQAATRG